MSSNKRVTLACASLTLLAGLWLQSAPAALADETADDFMKLQQQLSANDPDNGGQDQAPAVQAPGAPLPAAANAPVVAPAKPGLPTPPAASAKLDSLMPTMSESDKKPTPVKDASKKVEAAVQPATGGAAPVLNLDPVANTAPAGESTQPVLSPDQPGEALALPAEHPMADMPAPQMTSGDVTYLNKVDAINKEIYLLDLLNKKQALQDNLDKATGVMQQRQAAIAAAQQKSAGGNVKPQAPEDDPATLPGVTAILATHGKVSVEMTLASGGWVTAHLGDTLPGGWKLSRVADNAVYVTSIRTKQEFVLGPGKRLGTNAVTTKTKSSKKPAAETPKEDSSNVVLAPAN